MVREDGSMLKQCGITLALFIGIGIGWILRGNQMPVPEPRVIHLQPVWDGKKFRCELEERELKADE